LKAVWRTRNLGVVLINEIKVVLDLWAFCIELIDSNMISPSQVMPSVDWVKELAKTELSLHWINYTILLCKKLWKIQIFISMTLFFTKFEHKMSERWMFLLRLHSFDLK